jgi:hypothetical protein
MLTFLFWNLNGKDLSASLTRLVRLHGVDILILAESRHPQTAPALLLEAFNTDDPLLSYHHAPSNCRSIEIFTRFVPRRIVTLRDEPHYTIRQVTIPDRLTFILLAAHLLSPRVIGADTRYSEAYELARTLRAIEQQQGHARTVLAGDLNMNPFEAGMASAYGLHGVMTREIARLERRQVQGKNYPYFYNPMWRFFGDHPVSPPGSFYYRKSEHLCYFWNIFDQVLIRPALLPFWQDESLTILTSDGVVNFLSERGAIRRGELFSDHLPLLFRLEI